MGQPGTTRAYVAACLHAMCYVLYACMPGAWLAAYAPACLRGGRYLRRSLAARRSLVTRWYANAGSVPAGGPAAGSSTGGTMWQCSGPVKVSTSVQSWIRRGRSAALRNAAQPDADWPPAACAETRRRSARETVVSDVFRACLAFLAAETRGGVPVRRVYHASASQLRHDAVLLRQQRRHCAKARLHGRRKMYRQPRSELKYKVLRT
ncbi:hypothetical protein B0O95_11084 [Mycetohabitans endofungorum]|uniref:Uncharacterized protein n=1 Tax=Mycetohabitans endofungorum TaxID=417203 RepID=A0A2P5K8T7_9BURK|nr:hypothetical protein B0O95_11084 [Mycetohabitans endofungorum]